MNCPKCLGKLEKRLIGTFEEKPFHIDRCFLCHGIWFDSKELTMALSLKFPIVAPASDDTSPNTKFDFNNEVKAPCPRCNKAFEKVPSIQDYRIKLDYCLTCDGYWTDRGEFELLSKGGYFKRALNHVFGFLEKMHRWRNTRYMEYPKD